MTPSQVVEKLSKKIALSKLNLTQLEDKSFKVSLFVQLLKPLSSDAELAQGEEESDDSSDTSNVLAVTAGIAVMALPSLAEDSVTSPQTREDKSPVSAKSNPALKGNPVDDLTVDDVLPKDLPKTKASTTPTVKTETAAPLPALTIASPDPIEKPEIPKTENKAVSISSLVSKVAKEVGVDEKLLKTFVLLESSGNPYAKSPTGAIGLTQFTTIAWEEASNIGGKTYGIEHPIPDTIRGTRADPRFDPYKNLIAGALVLKQGIELLTKNGVEPTPVALYSYHNVGPSTTLAVYGKRAHTEKTKRAIKKQGAGFDTSNYLSRTQQRVELAAASVDSSKAFTVPIQVASAKPSAVAANSTIAMGSTTVVASQGIAPPVQVAEATPVEPFSSSYSPGSSTLSGTYSTIEHKPQEMTRDKNGRLLVMA